MNKLSYNKCVRKMLVKLTPDIRFFSPFIRASFQMQRHFGERAWKKFILLKKCFCRIYRKVDANNYRAMVWHILYKPATYFQIIEKVQFKLPKSKKRVHWVSKCNFSLRATLFIIFKKNYVANFGNIFNLISSRYINLGNY